MSVRVTDRREIIKERAMALFAERGVDAVSVRDIAAACGMSSPNLYAHFGSLDDLIRELFREGYEAYGERMSAVADGPGTFRERLEAVLRLVCRLHDEDRNRFRFILMTQHWVLDKIRLGDMNPVEIVMRMVANAMKDGEIPPGNPELVAAAIVGLVIQPATFIAYGRIGNNLAASADAIVAMCLAAVGGAAKATKGRTK